MNFNSLFFIFNIIVITSLMYLHFFFNFNHLLSENIIFYFVNIHQQYFNFPLFNSYKHVTFKKKKKERNLM